MSQPQWTWASKIPAPAEEPAHLVLVAGGQLVGLLEHVLHISDDSEARRFSWPWRPYLNRVGEEVVAGDVLAIEPGCYRPGFGGCRLEDLVVVTDAGCEVLTDYPYELAP